MSAKSLKEQLKDAIEKVEAKEVPELLANWRPAPESLQGLTKEAAKRKIREAFNSVLHGYSDERLRELFEVRIQLMLSRRPNGSAERKELEDLLQKLRDMQLSVKVTGKQWCDTRDYYNLRKKLNELDKITD